MENKNVCELDEVLTGARIEPEVCLLRPDFAVLLMVASGLPGGPSDDASDALLAAAEEQVTPDHPHEQAWADAYRAFGAKPNRTRPSVTALRRRPGLPRINKLVDVYNAVSVRHALPVGGEDLDAYRGAPRLFRARGDEEFETSAGVEHPEPGEVVWGDDAGVTCRRWNWRQCARTQITERTGRALFMLERLEPMTLTALLAAGEELRGHLEALGADVRTRLMR
ncbi:cytoplasmic protein [Lentzea tibetensis]|uniref:Cytoplasmic protein n=1 Tax=Lentzea tibetensis TaxID=2591470 RepID=A0A563EH71_9PSEU|nr:phenylalanine--tRNA ligase beta subunit-related protein [Lentzea tibetensis]TWP45722.1 cytoplasmic protein [Lentzea tibetensis]